MSIKKSSCKGAVTLLLPRLITVWSFPEITWTRLACIVHRQYRPHPPKPFSPEGKRGVSQSPSLRLGRRI